MNSSNTPFRLWLNTLKKQAYETNSVQANYTFNTLHFAALFIQGLCIGDAIATTFKTNSNGKSLH